MTITTTIAAYRSVDMLLLADVDMEVDELWVTCEVEVDEEVEDAEVEVVLVEVGGRVVVAEMGWTTRSAPSQ